MSLLSRRALGRAACVAASLALAAAPARAQLGGVNPFSFGVSGGAAIPTGDLADGVKTGYTIDGLVAVRIPTSPVSFRGEVGYTRFDIKNSDASFDIVSGVANLVLGLSPGGAYTVRPYLIGGVGAYGGRRIERRGNVTITSDREVKFGLNGGVGIEIPLSGITGFGEIRYTSVFTEGSNTNFLPIRFGIRF